jgi:hypothetical protein
MLTRKYGRRDKRQAWDSANEGRRACGSKAETPSWVISGRFFREKDSRITPVENARVIYDVHPAKVSG